MLSFFRSLSWPTRIGFALLVFCVLLSIGITVAHAQTVPGSIKLGWTLPTVGCTNGVTPCDNKPLTGVDALTAVEVYISTAPIPDTFEGIPTVELTATATTTTQTMQVANGSTLYSRIKVRNNGNRSPFSNQVSKVVVAGVKPGVPTNVTIEITITPTP